MTWMTKSALVSLLGALAVSPLWSQRPATSADSTAAPVRRMKSDLINLVVAQEAFFADAERYTTTIGAGGVDYKTSPGNAITRLRMTPDGWVAAIRNAKTKTICVIFVGSEALAPASEEAVPACGPEHLLGQTRTPPSGTYQFILCHPACTDPTHQVGHGVFVVADGDIRELAAGLDSLPDVSRRTRPNACFRVLANDQIGDREYYPSIIPVGLSSVLQAGEEFSIRLYASPDAFFSVILRFDSSGAVTGQGRQNDWNGRGPVEFSVLAGRRTGDPDPQECFKPS